MLTKEQALNLLGVLATTSIMSVGFAIGGTIGAAAMAGIGINLSSAIIHSGSAKLKERWLSSNDGILNHDIQLALVRAFVKALTYLETKYFKLGEANSLPKDEKESIKALFKALREQAQATFVTSIEKAVSEQEVKDYLYGRPETARDNLWQRINGAKLLHTYGEHLRDFLRENLLDEVLFWFSEELKTDNKECNKAWRAFQRLLLEGIQADVKTVQARQDVIQQDLQTLNGLKNQLDQLKDTIDHRLPNEPFQEGLEKAINEMQAVLHDVARTTQRTEEKVDDIAADVKTLLDSKTKVEIPKVPDDIQELFEEWKALRDLGKYEDARSVLQKSLELATSYKHNLAIAKAKYGLAVILNEWDKKPAAAKVLLQECLRELRDANSEEDVAATLYYLGAIELNAGDLDQAKAYFSQALDIDKKKGLKLSIAQDFHQLGWIEDHHGHSRQALELYDQALTYFLSVYQEGNTKTEKDAIYGIAGCYHHKGLVCEHDGKVEEAESNYVQALNWNRKSGFKLDIGRILYLLARLKYREGQYDAGTQFLDEATNIYNETGDYSYYARCLDLKGRLYFTLGQTDEATAIFESALNAVEKSGDYKEQEAYLNKLGHVYLEARKLEQAKGYFERARDLSLREGLLDGYATSVENLAQIAHIEKNHDERNRLLSDGIQTLEKLLLSVQAEPERAFITGQIGFFYERMENLQQALVYYQKAMKSFESLSDIGGVANCLGCIARMKGLLGKKNEEFDTYRELRKLLDGSPYYDLIAGTAINLGEIQMQIGNLDEAKMLFQEAELLCRKYNLHYLPHLRKSIERLEEEINLRKPPELNIKQLMAELFELVNWFPEAKDSIFRLWMWGRKEALLGNYRNTAGIKFMLCQDDVDTFLRTSKVLHPYSDLCLQVISSEYPGTGIDIIPFPMDKEIFFDGAIPAVQRGEGIHTVSFLRGGIHSRYTLTAGTMVRSKVTGNEGVTITGWSLGLPDQAHQLILSSSAAELTDQRIFFLPYERHLANDKLATDLRLSKELGIMPVYFDALPNSDSVQVLTSTTIHLPVLLPEDAQHQRTQIRKIKRSLSRLLSVTKDSAQSALNDFTFEIEELSDSYVDKPSIKIQIDILQFPGALGRELHIALVISNY
ncbi:tetratricopeptide repeat protein [Candidatus Poribacteria bacterium]|nr:tetratricopeptide repeat protein [Candidatus Poribacteria bacterium]